MSLYLTALDSEDEDEVFTGPITLAEIKKRFLPKNQRQTVGYPVASNEGAKLDESIKIIETHSTPNILKSEDPFFQVEKSTDLYLSCDNIVDNFTSESDHPFKENIKETISTNCHDDDKQQYEETASNLCLTCGNIVEKFSNEPDHSFEEYIKETNPTHFHDDGTGQYKKSATNASVPAYLKPHNNNSNKNLAVPQIKVQSPDIPVSTRNTHKTPKISSKTPSKIPSKTPSKTPSKDRFQHVLSPVATYINQYPVVMMRNVTPKKGLSGCSAIPVPIKSVKKPNTGNKENFKLPSVAYEAAKKTKMIIIPDKSKLPQSKSMKQVVPSTSGAVVIKHEHREGKAAKQPLLQNGEDSCVDLTINQAELSVCTQKTAYKFK